MKRGCGCAASNEKKTLATSGIKTQNGGARTQRTAQQRHNGRRIGVLSAWSGRVISYG